MVVHVAEGRLKWEGRGRKGRGGGREGRGEGREGGEGGG